MSNGPDEKLESMLRSRRVGKADPELAARIILRALSLPQRNDISFWKMVQDVFAEFRLPRPAFALAGAVVLGVVVGVSTPSQESVPPDGVEVSAQPFFTGDEGFL